MKDSTWMIVIAWVWLAVLVASWSLEGVRPEHMWLILFAILHRMCGLILRALGK